MLRKTVFLVCFTAMFLLCGCGSKTAPSFKYVPAEMQPGPKWLQGVAYYDGSLYVTSDDGDADDDAPDHMYRIDVANDKKTGKVVLEKTFDDVTRQGEIEGLTFDKERGQFLLLYNRGAKIVAGMPTGFYEGYTEEIHEVFVYDIAK